MRVLSNTDVATVLSLSDLLPVVEDAFLRSGRGAVECPPRPHFPIGAGLRGPDPTGTGLIMSAYLHGESTFATKIVGVTEDNPTRGHPTVNAAIALTDAETGSPVAYMAGNDITNARTGCLGGLAARTFSNHSPDSIDLGIIGAGEQARWQARAIATATDVDTVRIYSPSDSRFTCAEWLRDRGIDATAVSSPGEAVSDVDVVVTATTATAPVFDGADVDSGTLVVAVGAYTAEMRELDERIVERAALLVADVPDEVAATGDFPGHDADSFVPFASILADLAAGSNTSRSAWGLDEDSIVIVASVGTAVLDAAAAGFVYDVAREEGVGTDVEL